MKKYRLRGRKRERDQRQWNVVNVGSFYGCCVCLRGDECTLMRVYVCRVDSFFFIPHILFLFCHFVRSGGRFETSYQLIQAHNHLISFCFYFIHSLEGTDYILKEERTRTFSTLENTHSLNFHDHLIWWESLCTARHMM